MADQTVKLVQDDVAATAYSMAGSLWFEEKNSHPKASDRAFLQLVNTCSRALRGQFESYNFDGK